MVSRNTLLKSRICGYWKGKYCIEFQSLILIRRNILFHITVEQLSRREFCSDLEFDVRQIENPSRHRNQEIVERNTLFILGFAFIQIISGMCDKNRQII